MEPATHNRAAWADLANETIEVGLDPYGMPGRVEVFPVQRCGDGEFLVCCVPFFTYGICLGDVITVDDKNRHANVRQKSEHRVVRIALAGDVDVTPVHSFIHAWLEKEQVLHEWRGHGYVAVDVPPGRALTIPTPLEQRQKEGLIQIEQF